MNDHHRDVIGNLWRFPLISGSGGSPERGACVMEAVSWYHDGTMSDHPDCACPVFAMYGRATNDYLPSDTRQRLTAYIPRFIGTVDQDAMALRAECLAWHAIRILPRVFSLSGLNANATTLRTFVGSFSGSLLAASAFLRVALKPYLEPDLDLVNSYAYTAVRGTLRAAEFANGGGYESAAAEAARTFLAAHRLSHGDSQREVEEAIFASLDDVLLIGKQADALDETRFSDAVERFAAAQLPQEVPA